MDHLALLEGEVVAMADALRDADPAQPVPACPGWTVRELAAHVTGVHRWVLKALDNNGPPPFDETPDDGDLAARYAEAAQAMVQRLRELPKDAPAWTFNKNDGTAGFWHRRQLHEVAIHRWDAQPYVLDDAIATDGIDEVFDFFVPRQLTRGSLTLPAERLTLTTGDRTWHLGEGPETAVEGKASDLLLMLWQRSRTLPGTWAQTPLTP